MLQLRGDSTGDIYSYTYTSDRTSLLDDRSLEQQWSEYIQRQTNQRSMQNDYQELMERYRILEEEIMRRQQDMNFVPPSFHNEYKENGFLIKELVEALKKEFTIIPKFEESL